MNESLTHYFGPFTPGAVAATWSESADALRVLFDRSYYDALGVASNQPRARVRDTDFSGVAAGQTLAIAGVTYTIVGLEPDGQGTTVLRLEAA